MTHTTLRDWGWDDAWSESAEAHGPGAAEPTRVVGQERGRWSIQTAHGAREARISTGRRSAALPVVGDWILAERGPSPSIRGPSPPSSPGGLPSPGARQDPGTRSRSWPPTWT